MRLKTHLCRHGCTGRHHGLPGLFQGQQPVPFPSFPGFVPCLYPARQGPVPDYSSPCFSFSFSIGCNCPATCGSGTPEQKLTGDSRGNVAALRCRPYPFKAAKKRQSCCGRPWERSRGEVDQIIGTLLPCRFHGSSAFRTGLNDDLVPPLLCNCGSRFVRTLQTFTRHAPLKGNRGYPGIV